MTESEKRSKLMNSDAEDTTSESDPTERVDAAQTGAGQTGAVPTTSPSRNEQLQADKKSDPRVKVSRRGVLLGLGVALLGVVGAAASIYARRTRLEKSTEFWGIDTITAFQLGERIALESVSGDEFDPVDLSGTPGLGHLRHALLDERNYLWETKTDEPMESLASTADSYCIRLTFTDPTAKRFSDRSILMDLSGGGWTGHEQIENNSEMSSSLINQRVQLNERVRTAMKKFLETLVTVEQKRYDKRR